MIAIIGLVIPSILGVYFFEILSKDKNSTLERKISVFLVLLLFSSILNFVSSKLFFNITENIELSLNKYPIFFVKYVLLSLVFDMILSFVCVIVSKYIHITIEVKGNEDNK